LHARFSPTSGASARVELTSVAGFDANGGWVTPVTAWQRAGTDQRDVMNYIAEIQRNRRVREGKTHPGWRYLLTKVMFGERRRMNGSTASDAGVVATCSDLHRAPSSSSLGSCS
jgi:hypothetical protein